MLKKLITLLTIIFLFFIGSKVEAQNIGTDQKNYQKAILAGGCFWGVEELFKNQEGVVNTKVGYIGGKVVNPNYAIISTGLTNYAESIEITFDSQKTSYETLLKFFFTIHDPTTLNYQQNDVGRQYRSAIFYLNDEQKEVAKNVINLANKSGVFSKPVVTTLEKAGKFYDAEDYHQDYLDKNPGGYTCHHIRSEWKF
jgi:methionine-S-sulfoxide reductase